MFPGGKRSPFAHDRPLRVLLVSPRYLPDLGGIETHIHEVGTRLSRRPDMDVTVLCTDRTGELPRREERDGLTVLRCRAWPPSRDYYIAPGLYQRVRFGNYDLVHCQGIHTPVPVLAMLAARRANLPCVVTFHTGGHSSTSRHALRGVQWKVLGPLLRSTAALVGVSRFEVELFRRVTGLPGDRFHVIRNGGALPLPVEKVAPIAGRIVSSARLERYKGHQHVIRALPHVRRLVPGATLSILGSGPYQRQLEDLARELGVSDNTTIEDVPPRDRTGMSRRLREAQVFAAFSEYEAHPVAVMEALTLGLPVVGYDTAGMRELVEEGLVTGIDPQSSPEDAAATLVAAIRASRPSSAPELPTWDDAANALARLYWDVVVRSPKKMKKIG